MNKARTRDQFLYALLAVVFGAAAVIFFRWHTETKLKDLVTAKQQAMPEVRTPDQMMDELSKTADDGGQADFQQLQKDASGL